MHGRNRAEVSLLVQKLGADLRRREIDEALLVKDAQHVLLLLRR
ncbi:MAG TPA: hypothetical protein VN033_00340 [Vulgatibacter sp.]|nr:hypothetical protein [Vulgatibacter sp.]